MIDEQEAGQLICCICKSIQENTNNTSGGTSTSSSKGVGGTLILKVTTGSMDLNNYQINFEYSFWGPDTQVLGGLARSGLPG